MLRKIAKVFLKFLFKSSNVKKIISELKRNRLERFPLVVQVESTTACNADCIMCPHSKLTRAGGHMDFNLYKQIVDECSKHQRQMKYFFPFLNGELFLVPGWQDYLAYARDKLPYTKIGIFTNGSLLNAKNTDAILKIQPDWIHVSFDGTSKEVFESIRRNLNFEQIESNIIGFINERKKFHQRKPRLTISVIRMKKNAEALADFLTKWRKIVDNVTVESYCNWGGAVIDDSFGRKAGKRNACFRLWTNLTVLVNGDTCLCCLDYEGKILLGDLREESIVDIWQGEKLKNIRRIHLAAKFNDIELCSRCNYRKYETASPIWW